MMYDRHLTQNPNNYDTQFRGDVEINYENYTTTSLNSKFRKNYRNLLFFHLNIQSFNRNYDEFSVLLDKVAPAVDMISFLETRFFPTLTLGIDGYQSFHSFRSVKRVVEFLFTFEIVQGLSNY